MAYFAMVCVALCVAMMLIVVSVMNGFLDKFENAARGLFGDVVVDAPGLGGLAHYDEFIAELKREIPEVKAATPFILTYGILRLADKRYDHRQTVQIAGIRLPERANATSFAQGLFIQQGDPRPSFDPPLDQVVQRLEAETRRTADIRERLLAKPIPDLAPPSVRAERDALVGVIDTAIQRQEIAAYRLRKAAPHQQRLRDLQKKLDEARREAGGSESTEVDQIQDEILDLEKIAGLDAPSNRVILGLGLPALTKRTPKGETIRVVGPGEKIVLVTIPLGRKLATGDILPDQGRFTVMDDCSTDVAPIDSEIVYVPFKTLQLLNNMGAEYDPDDPKRIVTPPRCGQIHIKVKQEYANGRELVMVWKDIRKLWLDFLERYPAAAAPGSDVQTWRQHQARYIGPIQQQRTLTVIMFGIISMVSVVLIFVILYMIVYQKTRDIGVLKAIGASSGGVSYIFLLYGGAVGLVGSILGTIGGYYFVRYINPIQDFLDHQFGFRVYDREVFMFEKIPNQVEVFPAVMIIVGAIIAGLLGALLPSIRAARMQPVEALRYE